jgi:hypothetical protein
MTADYTFFSAAHRTFSKIDRILDHKAKLSKYKNTEIILYILTDYNRIKSKINGKQTTKTIQTRGD